MKLATFFSNQLMKFAIYICNLKTKLIIIYVIALQMKNHLMNFVIFWWISQFFPSSETHLMNFEIFFLETICQILWYLSQYHWQILQFFPLRPITVISQLFSRLRNEIYYFYPRNIWQILRFFFPLGSCDLCHNLFFEITWWTSVFCKNSWRI